MSYSPDGRIYLPVLERKIIKADFRDIKRKLMKEIKDTKAIDFNRLVNQMILKYTKVTGLALLQGHISPEHAKAEIEMYKAEIPRIFAEVFEMELDKPQ